MDDFCPLSRYNLFSGKPTFLGKATDRAISFTDLEDALDHLCFQETNSEPILILSDINMPVMTGFEFLEFIVLEEFPTNIDVDMVTSSIFDGDRSVAGTFPRYIKDFASKPLRAEKLEELVQTPMTIALCNFEVSLVSCLSIR